MAVKRKSVPKKKSKSPVKAKTRSPRRAKQKPAAGRSSKKPAPKKSISRKALKKRIPAKKSAAGRSAGRTQKIGYIDGFLIPVRIEKIPEYIALSMEAGVVWMEHGALTYCETFGDDLAGNGKTSFPAILQTGPDETSIFSWIGYRDKAHRDKVNALVMKDSRILNMMEKMGSEMPFDSDKMLYGGFNVKVLF